MVRVVSFCKIKSPKKIISVVMFTKGQVGVAASSGDTSTPVELSQKICEIQGRTSGQTGAGVVEVREGVAEEEEEEVGCDDEVPGVVEGIMVGGAEEVVG